MTRLGRCAAAPGRAGGDAELGALSSWRPDRRLRLPDPQNVVDVAAAALDWAACRKWAQMPRPGWPIGRVRLAQQ